MNAYMVGREYLEITSGFDCHLGLDESVIFWDVGNLKWYRSTADEVESLGRALIKYGYLHGSCDHEAEYEHWLTLNAIEVNEPEV